MNGSVVKVEEVTKRFAGHTAVERLSLEVPGGGIFGLLGPNGAGKSTTIRMIMNIITPDQGRISVLGSASSRALSGRIGYLPEERGLYKKMKVVDQLTFFGEAKGITRKTARVKAGEWLGRLGISDWAVKKVEDLSKGMQQKVQFIGALLHEPDLVILDEPFSGLDPVNSQVMKDVVVDIARQGKTVLFSTHIMEQAEKMCDRIVIISRGRKVVDGSLAEVKRDFGGRHVALTFTRNAERAGRVLADRSLVAKLDDYGATAEVELAAPGDPDRLLQTLVREEVGLARFEVVEASLQSIFIAKVGVEAATAPAKETVHA
ncbi:MAG TPA: ATP-binding cassette domain-containing protein [Gemmatimonadales bacterium]|nr:ATP-binding cassette domain-containing protein [Gemmatimonadales bacterium]